MGRVFLRKEFSNYLGENRSILDINSSFIPNTPTPSVTVTPTPTKTNTPTPTPTKTNTPTPSSTIVVTATATPTNTPTNTQTPTITPTQSPYPVCPSQINVTTDPSLGLVFSASTGTYNRLFTYSGGSFNSGWVSRTGGSDWNFFTGAFSGDSKDYVLYGLNDGVQYYVLVWTKNLTSLPRYYLLASSGNYFMNGSVVNGALQFFTASPLPESGGFVYPLTGNYGPYNYLSYPSSCPTPTPTNTNTPTPSSTPAPSLDPDAVAYLNLVVGAGGTVTPTMSAATDTLYTQLKSTGLWNKITYMYPMLGGTATSCVIEGRQHNGTYDMSLTGTGIFNSTGYNPNHASYVRLKNVITNTFGPNGDNHLGLYISSGATTIDNGYDLCASDGNNSDQNYIIVRFNGTNTTYYSYVGSYSQSLTTTDSTGHWIMSRNVGNTQTQLYRNGVGTPIATTTTLFKNCTTQFYLGVEVANGIGTGLGATNSKTYSFVHLGTRLDSSDNTLLASIINTFNTTLGRNTY